MLSGLWQDRQGARTPGTDPRNPNPHTAPGGSRKFFSKIQSVGDLINIDDLSDGPGDFDRDDDSSCDDTDALVLAHPLVVAFRDASTTTVERLRLIQVAMARCAAELAFQTERPQHFEQPEAGRAVSRRVRALKRIAEVELAEARSCGPRSSQVDHPDTAKLLDFFFQRVVGIFHEALPENYATSMEYGLRKALEEDPAIPWSPPGATP